MKSKKSTIVAFESFAVSHIPECKKPLSGIRAGSIKKQRQARKEPSIKQDPISLTNFTPKPIQSPIKPSLTRPKARRLLSSSYDFQGKALQVAFYNFLPSLESFSYQITPKNKGLPGYLTVKENKYMHKYFEKSFKSSGISKFDKSITVKKVFRSASNEGMQGNDSDVIEDSTKLVIPRYDSPDYEDCPVKEYFNMLEPRFKA